MSLKSFAFCLTALIFAANCFAQTQPSVDIIAKWKNGETHAVKINSTTTDNKSGQSQNYLSTFDARFVVKEVAETGYKLEWTYTNAKLAENEPGIENQVLGKMINTKLLIKLSDVGQFADLLNADEVRKVADKVLDELIAASTANQPMNLQFKGAKQLITSKQGLEIALLKQVKLYLLSFGFSYKLNFIQTNNLKITNPLGGPQFDAVEKIQLTKLDTKDSVCVIETSKIVDGRHLKAAVIDYVKKATNSNQQAIDEMNKASLEITESSMHRINFSKGIVQKAFFKRIMNLGFQNRTTVLEIESVN